jgi:hypothetical protein
MFYLATIITEDFREFNFIFYTQLSRHSGDSSVELRNFLMERIHHFSIEVSVLSIWERNQLRKIESIRWASTYQHITDIIIRNNKDLKPHFKCNPKEYQSSTE